MTGTADTPRGSEDCVFCAIARGEDEASLVHQDDDVVAFMDLQPVTPGHLLVVPRGQWRTGWHAAFAGHRFAAKGSTAG